MRRARTSLFAACITGAIALSSGIAQAQKIDSSTDPTLLPRLTERRSGVVIGTSLGLGFGGSTGYPDRASFIGDPRARGASGIMFGRGMDIFLLGAITDYLNFGLWFGMNTFEDDNWKAESKAGGFRIEVFPLYKVHRHLRDLAVFTQLGFGSAALDAKGGTYGGADGAQSHLGLGAFYEFSLFKMLGGHVSAGPSLEYGAVLSRSLDHHGLLAGGRLVFYGGP